MRVAMLLPFLFMTAPLLGADLTITEQTTGQTWTVSLNLWHSGSRSRMETRLEPHLGLADSLMRAPAPHVAAIYQCDERRIVEVNLDTREYMALRLDENGVPVGSKPA